MRIAVYHNLPSGGAKRSLYETMKRLSQRHTMDVYTLNTSDREYCNLSRFSHAEIIFHFSPSRLFQSPFGRLNQIQRWRDLKRLDRLARRISKQIDDGGYDIVFAQPCMWTQAPLVLRHLRTPALYYCHEPPRHLYETIFGTATNRSVPRQVIDWLDPFITLYRTSGKRLDRTAVRSARRVLVNSLFIRDRVREIYQIEPFLSYHGVDTDLYRPATTHSTGNYILSVGAIQRHKGFDFLIESIGQVDEKIRPPLWLVGNMVQPSERAYLQSLAGQKKVELHIEVGLNQETLLRKYQEASLVVYAPYNEPFGLVPLEAMACGKAVIGVNEGGVPETVVHEVTGLLVDRNPTAFGQAVQRLLENPSLANQYGCNGRKLALDHWSWEKAVANLEESLYAIVQ